ICHHFNIIVLLIQCSNLHHYPHSLPTRRSSDLKDIASITFTSVSKNPMDTLVFSGYFNGDEDERFTASIMSHEENFEYHSAVNRSEEHTSELQSRFDLVCRLLLEKKKYN